jgi:hypothetical protein
MAKALLGYMSSDLRDPSRALANRLAAENRQLRERVLDLEALVVRLQDENDRLAAAQGTPGQTSRRCSRPDRFADSAHPRVLAFLPRAALRGRDMRDVSRVPALLVSTLADRVVPARLGDVARRLRPRSPG